jgi:hypothetical protein
MLATAFPKPFIADEKEGLETRLNRDVSSVLLEEGINGKEMTLLALLKSEVTI